MELFAFLEQVNRLKTVRRTGWIVEGIREPESVADHSFGMTLLTLILGRERKGLDLNKAVKMGLTHDLAESIIGDVLVDWKVELNEGKPMPGKHHGISSEEKYRLEKKAFRSLANKLPHGEELLELWEEFEAGKTEEAKFVREMDRLDMLFQAMVYERNEEKDLSRWFRGKRNAIEDPEIKKIFNALLQWRDKGR